MAKSGAQPNYLPFSQLDEFGVLSQVLLQQNLLSPLSPPTTPRQDVLIQSNNRVVQLKLPEYPTSQQQQQQQRIPITSTLTSAPIPVAAAAVNSTTELPSLKGNCPVPVLQNIVSAVNLGVPLDLKKIAREARNAEYNPRRFAAVVLRLREPKATALVFSSGKMVVNGARSEDDARLASRKFARIIQKLGYPEATFKEFKIHNVVASSDIRMRLRLNDLRMGHRAHTDYEPELFPGLIYRMQKPRVTLLIFHSGKIVLTGARTRLDVYQAFEAIYPVLVQYGRPLS